MSDPKPKESTQYKCSNCRAVVGEEATEDTAHGNPLCPECNVEELTEVTKASCPNCFAQEFEVTQRAQGESITGADPHVGCVECGRRGELDDSGVWW